MDQRRARFEVFSGWKDIANYLGKGVRTVQRYERELKLPIDRPAGKSRGAVIATKVELDAWITAGPVRRALGPSRPTFSLAPLLEQFRLNLEQLRQLRTESRVARDELHRAVELLHKSIQGGISQHFSAHSHFADLPPVDPKKKVH